jgi:hypothetical protein
VIANCDARDSGTNFNNNASGWITGFGTRLAFDF